VGSASWIRHYEPDSTSKRRCADREEGTLYPALWRLEGKGLLESEWGLSENNRKAKFYSLTTAGKRRLRDEVKTWEAYAAAVAKVLGATQSPLREELG
jgi:PadR family transcriptional regulator, regulatory protein PadR